MHHINKHFSLLLRLYPTTTMTNHPANLADPVLLEKIDKFFELGIGEYVALPQVRPHSARRCCMATNTA